MGMREEIDAALHAHAAWRKHFKDYLNGRAAFDTHLAGVTDQCEFGRWLAHEGHRLMPTEIHGQIIEAHTEFHHVADEIVRNIKAKRFDRVKQDLAPEGAFNRTSARLSDLLHKATLHERGAAVPAATQASPAAETTSPPAAA